MHKTFAVGMLAAAVLAGCGQARSEAGPAVERNFTVGAFDRIEVMGPYEVDVRTGSQPSVRASGPEKSIERMVVEVRGNTLSIHPRKRNGLNFNWSGDRETVRLAVTVPSLVAAEIAGSGDIAVDKIAGESFEGGVAGSGDLRLGNVEVKKLKVGIAGSGAVRAQGGRAAEVNYEIAGSGDIDMAELVADSAAVSIAGSGNVNANATRTASVDIAGSGDVRIRGGAQCKVSKAGSGNVECS